jgi:hypothetical protein
MKTNPIDDFIKRRVQPEHYKVMAYLRKLMREVAPGVKEEFTYGVLAWRGVLIIAVISPTKKDITLAFSKGAEFEDKYDLLQGVGKVSKHVKIRDLKEVDEAALKYYIKQALKHDKK